MTRKERAMQLFTEGYNCSQAVSLAFEDLLPIDREALAKLSLSFGGGMGRLREVCGAVSGMFIVAGLLYGEAEPVSGSVKAEHYERIQSLAHDFEAQNGSIICRELLGLQVKHDCPVSAPRTSEFYKKRPCRELVGLAAQIMDDYIAQHPVSLT